MVEGIWKASIHNNNNNPKKKKDKKVEGIWKTSIHQKIKKKQWKIIANNLNNHSSIKQAKHYKLQS